VNSISWFTSKQGGGEDTKDGSQEHDAEDGVLHRSPSPLEQPSGQPVECSSE